MSIQNPMIFWAFLALAVPVIIHLFGKQPKKSVRISSLMWLKEVKPSERRKKRLKDLLVLFFRTLTIFFVVSSLIKWVSDDRVENLIIDNHPAHWQKNWCQDLINELPEGVYRTFLRDGSFLGQWSKADLPEIVANVSSNPARTDKFLKGTLLSYGFDSIPPSQFSQILLPDRRRYDNPPLIVRVNQNSLQASVDSTLDLQWEMYRNGKLFSTDYGEQITVPKTMFSSKDTFEIKALSDSVLVDNTITVFRESPKKTMVIRYDNQACWSCSFLKPDSILLADQLSSLQGSSFGVIVLEGFDFLPEELSDFNGLILQFYPSQQAPKVPAIPVLDHPFYAEYFLGPSLQNRWPKYPDVSDWAVLNEEIQPILTTRYGTPIAGFSSDGQKYVQLFHPQETEHPFYTALFKFAGANSTLSIRVPSHVGVDHYNENLLLEGVKISEKTTQIKTSKDQFWNREKIALALALLSAALALIFAKI